MAARTLESHVHQLHEAELGALIKGVSLPGKLVLVTGASSGIGAATSVALSKEGAHVVLVARSKGKLEEVAASIKAAGGKATVLVVDSGDCDATADGSVGGLLGPPAGNGA